MNSRRYCQERSRNSVTRIAESRDGGSTSPTGRTAGNPRSCSVRKTAYSLRAVRNGSSLRAYNLPSASTNFTRCRLGPTGMSRIATSAGLHSASGSSQGSARSSAPAARIRTLGTSGTAYCGTDPTYDRQEVNGDGSLRIGLIAGQTGYGGRNWVRTSDARFVSVASDITDDD